VLGWHELESNLAEAAASERRGGRFRRETYLGALCRDEGNRHMNDGPTKPGRTMRTRSQSVETNKAGRAKPRIGLAIENNAI
jgi:hypothetical protein